MASIQLSGLASGFDWKSFVDQIMDLERNPAVKMQAEIANNQLKLTALSGLESRLGDLRGAIDALNSDGVFDANQASVTGAGWSASASTGTPVGAYSFNVTQRATAARLSGAADIGRPLAATADVTGVSLASLGTATTLTAGVFTINGAQVVVDLGESLDDLFARINTATAGAVAAAYDPATDRITLTSGSPILLGAANDTSNFLAAARLRNGATPVNAIASDSALGAVSVGATLANARLAAAITAVDGAGAGAFSVNGVSIAYNVNTDTLASLIRRINAAGAGVTAAFDASGDRISLTNTSTGNLGISVSEAAGGLMDALGLTGSAVLARGKHAEFTVNNGAILTSAGNTLSESSHGIAGLSVNASVEGGEETVTVGADTAGMRAKIDSFISKFNSLQGYIEDQSKVTKAANGKITASTLSANREIQGWASQLRGAIFGSVPGLAETLSRLDHIGIDFTGTSSTLAVKDSAKLTAALANRPAEVGALFRQPSTGLANKIDALLDSYIGNFGGDGLLKGQSSALAKSNTSLTQQIAEVDRRLEQRRAQLEAGFIAMERAQATIKQMQTQLTNSFPAGNSTK